MAALTLSTPIIPKVGTTEPAGEGQVKAGVHIFEGAQLGNDAAGFLRPWQSGDTFRGHAQHEVDNRIDELTGGPATDGGSDGNVRCKYYRGEYVVDAAIPAGMTAANVGSDIFATNDNPADNAATGTAGDEVGKLASVNEGRCEIRYTTAI